MPRKKKWVVRIVSHDSGKTVKKFEPCYSEREADKLDRGVNINLNHEKFYTTVTEE